MSGYLPDGCTQEMVDDAMGANDPCEHREAATYRTLDGQMLDNDEGEYDEWHCEDCGYSAFWNGARWVGSDERPEYDS
jgi:predicted nucleic-acid-binding Zn-ribbon protein